MEREVDRNVSRLRTLGKVRSPARAAEQRTGRRLKSTEMSGGYCSSRFDGKNGRYDDRSSGRLILVCAAHNDGLATQVRNWQSLQSTQESKSEEFQVEAIEAYER